ncbi:MULTISPECIES: helix-hairpin-helix domain-containing protein [unclassified Clostridium]|uniref:helix-hairpin-helix domain-containing protein n=1 Tax=Clostridium TaxID=1485 RepID=UPI001C8CC4F2|nr:MULTISPECIES: helix-hairpin-helix domain-containing protein [unclassified Clostridium]MBX9136530.1 competence protein ComEA [Clostridium sp. K12(2020)]MBX9142989.1 competence protein ComEA [Clostridium sp. K13]MDU2290775.1 helix-hairpin-helix domain-containing protein [Clostridium celatum]MDU4325338.1 helix-hairpin-helix domain-containing protein [Clostridium celatum]
MDKLKNKKVIGLLVALVVIISISLLTYRNNSKNVFKDEYMKNIFIDEDNINLENENNNIDYSLDFSEENNKEVKTDVINNITSGYDKTIVVEIKGEVNNPDVYTLKEGSIIKDLIEIAGGLTSNADISNINRAKEIKNHELIVIRNINDINIEVESIEAEINQESDDGIININDADLSKLKEIPGIGDVKANAIILYREENGGFKSIEEIKKVDGIGEKTFEKIKNSIKL